MANRRSINEELLQDAVMTACREALMGKYAWFKHISQFSSIGSIRCKGIEPRSDKLPPDYIAIKFGGAPVSIVCLHPVGSDLEPKGSKEPPFVFFALAGSDLPIRLGIDWSYEPNLPGVLRASYPDMPATEIMEAYAQRRGSIVSYDVIPPERLRVCTFDADEDNPNTWPLLVDVGDGAIRAFHR